MDASQVAPRLYVGPAPAPGEALPVGNVDMLVLAAEEHQPTYFPQFRGQVIRCGIEDSALRSINIEEKRRIRLAAKAVAAALYHGKRVLCTCQMGWNRSALVAGLALKMCTSLSCAQIVECLRKARGQDALSNPSFVEYLVQARVY